MAHRVAVAVVDGVALFELAVACEVFGTDRRDLTPDWYDFSLVAAEPGEIRTQQGLVLDTDFGVEALGSADTIIVPACVDVDAHDPLLVELRKAYDRGARIASVFARARPLP